MLFYCKQSPPRNVSIYIGPCYYGGKTTLESMTAPDDRSK
jgi:hypothetical protein